MSTTKIIYTVTQYLLPLQFLQFLTNIFLKLNMNILKISFQGLIQENKINDKLKCFMFKAGLGKIHVT